MVQTGKRTATGRSRLTWFLELFSWRIFFFILGLCLFKYFLFGYFAEDISLLSAYFILINLFIALFLGRYKAIFLFIFNTLYFITFISLTFINFFHFTWKSFVNSLQFYQQLDFSRYLLMLLLIALAIFILYAIPKWVFKGLVVKSKLANIFLWLGILALAFVIQKKYLTDYNTYTTNDHMRYRIVFHLTNRSDITNIIEEDRLFAYGVHLSDSLSSFSASMHSLPAFTKYSTDSMGGVQINILLESLGLFKEGQASHLFRDSISQWLDSNYTLTCDSVPFKGSTVDGELRELFNLRGDYNMIIESGKEFNSIFKEKKKAGYLTASVSSSNGKVFSDRLLYKKGGCDSSYFKEDYANLPNFNSNTDIDRESAFSGVRDEFTFDFMMKKIEASNAKRQFWYFLTINTHLPFTLNKNDKDSPAYKNFRERLSPDYSNDVSQLSFKFIQELKYFVKGAMSKGVASLVMVGDHSPPYFAASDRDHYSQEYVPVFAISKKR